MVSKHQLSYDSCLFQFYINFAKDPCEMVDQTSSMVLNIHIGRLRSYFTSSEQACKPFFKNGQLLIKLILKHCDIAVTIEVDWSTNDITIASYNSRFFTVIFSVVDMNLLE